MGWLIIVTLIALYIIFSAIGWVWDIIKEAPENRKKYKEKTEKEKVINNMKDISDMQGYLDSYAYIATGSNYHAVENASVRCREKATGNKTGYREYYHNIIRSSKYQSEHIKLLKEIHDYYSRLAKESEEAERARRKKKQEIEEAERKRKQEIEDKKNRDIASQIISENSDLLSIFMDIAYQKVSITDEYGDENRSALSDEITRLLEKIQSHNEGISLCGKLKLSLHSEIDSIYRRYHENRTKKISGIDVETQMTGIEFEMEVGRFLKSIGYLVEITKSSGDQGADIIARKDGRKIAIQVKRYAKKVTNKAVQEIVGAIGYYGADEGRVITNNEYTQSAILLAQKNGIRLFDKFNIGKIT